MKQILLTLFLLLSACGAARAQVVLCYADSVDGRWGEANTVVTPYVTYPATMTGAYAGNRVTALRLCLGAPATNVYLYIKADARDTQPLYRQKVGNLEAGWHDIALDTPFDLAEDTPLCLGYKASFAAAGGVAYSAGRNEQAGVIYYNSKNNWTSLPGSTCLHAIVEGDALPARQLRVGGLADLTAPEETDSVALKAVLRNMGTDTISSFRSCVEVDGRLKDVRDLPCHILPNGVDTLAFFVPTTAPGSHTVELSVVLVNGEADAWRADNVATCTVRVADPRFRRKVVCEEFTGTWCGWCPRGMVGLEMMKEKYPGRFLPISIHGGGNDPLEIDSLLPYSYHEFIQAQPGAPTCEVDRRLSGDPFDQIQMLFDTECRAAAGYAVELQAHFNADSTAIGVDARFVAEADVVRPDLRMAFVLTEDSVTGYKQANYYAGGRNGEMAGWENKTDPTTDFAYMDLARGIFGGFRGVPCTGAESLAAGEEQTFSYAFDLPETLADVRRLRVTALLLDAQTNYVLNADRTVPRAAEADGLRPVADGPQLPFRAVRRGTQLRVSVPAEGRLEVCSPDGRLLVSRPAAPGEVALNLPRGLYLVRFTATDGSARTLKAL